MEGDQGGLRPSQVRAANPAARKTTRSTAAGRRFQLFSPVPEINGRRNRTAIAATGAIKMSGVSSSAGKSARAAYSQRKKMSGLGTVSIIVGSGRSAGPNGPNTAAHTSTARMIKPANTKSRSNASGMNGTPSSCT